MNDARTVSAHWLLRSSQEIFNSLDVPDDSLEEDVSSSITLVERASSLIQRLIDRLNRQEHALSVAEQELIQLRADKEEATQRLAIAEEAILSQTERADRAEQLLKGGHEKAKRLEQANHNLSNQLQRVVTTVCKSLTLPRQEGSAANIAA